MLQVFVVFTCIFGYLDAVYHYDYEDTTPRPFSLKLNDEPSEDLQEHDFEPIVPLPIPKEKEKLHVQVRSIQCDNFARYATNCTLSAAVIYNSSRKTPPHPSKITHWCKAIRHLTNCAIDWNTDCKDVTDDHFNEDSIKGHLHVLGNICEDQWFLSREYNHSVTHDDSMARYYFCFSYNHVSIITIGDLMDDPVRQIHKNMFLQ